MIKFYEGTGHAIAVGPNPNTHIERPWSYDNGGAAGRIERLCGERITWYNIFDYEPKWTADTKDEALRRVLTWLLEEKPSATILALGRHVQEAFDVSDAEPLERFSILGNWTMIAVPHPSGLNRWWNEPRNVLEATRVLRKAARGEYL